VLVRLAVDGRAADPEQLSELCDRVVSGLNQLENVDALVGTVLRWLEDRHGKFMSNRKVEQVN
jgi:hypothetical protein